MVNFPENNLDPNYERNKFFNSHLRAWIKEQQRQILESCPHCLQIELDRLLVERYDNEGEYVIKHIWKEWDKSK